VAIALNLRVDGLDKLKLARRRAGVGPAATSPASVNSPSATRPLRVGSWDWSGSQADGPPGPAASELLARHVGQFDLLAIHGAQPLPGSFWKQVLETAEQQGRDWAIVVSPPVGPEQDLRHHVFLYDRYRVRVDRQKAYLVLDPDQLFTYDPALVHVAARIAPERAYTFILLSVILDQSQREREATAVDELFYSVRDGSRGEDDVIVGGNFHLDASELSEKFRRRTIRPLVVEASADVRAERPGPQLILDPRATIEYTGRHGMFDALRTYNLSLDQAEALSKWMPVWAEFATSEGALTASGPPQQETAR
jgi:hypothetical protein